MLRWEKSFLKTEFQQYMAIENIIVTNEASQIIRLTPSSKSYPIYMVSTIEIVSVEG